MNDSIQQHIDNIEQQVQIAEAGYVAFRRMYAQTNRRPEKKKYESRNWWARAAIGGVMIASSIVSASHTIPVFAGDMGADHLANLIHLFVGIAAFVMGEMALASYAYTGVMRHFRDTGAEPKSLKTLLRWGVGVPVVIMVAANVSHQFQTSGEYIDPRIMSIIRLAIALAAPLMAYISGEVFATFEVGDRIDAATLERENTEAEERWEEKCRAAWGREKGNYGGKIKIEPVPTSSNGFSNGIPLESGMENRRILPAASSIGHSKQPMARQMVVDYFTANPDALNGNAVEIAQQLGVGKSTVYSVIKEMRQ